jgi:hypothetical protein
VRARRIRAGLLGLVLCAAPLFAQETVDIPPAPVPATIRALVDARVGKGKWTLPTRLGKYAFDTCHNQRTDAHPFFVAGQFDGDDVEDVAFWILISATGNRVLVVSQSATNSIVTLTETARYAYGAGSENSLLYARRKGDRVFDQLTSHTYALPFDGVGVMECQQSAHVWSRDAREPRFNLYWLSD